MKSINFLFFILASCIIGCRVDEKSASFIRDTSGLEYKIITSNLGDPPVQGQFLKMHVKQVYNDSVISDTRNTMPQYLPFDTAEMSKDSYKIFSQVRVGDSIIFKNPSDSAFKSSKPAFAKSGGWLFTYVKVEAIFTDANVARVDMDEEEVRRGYKPKPQMPDSTQNEDQYRPPGY